MDETYVKVAGRWVYLYRAVDQFGQVIDVYATTRRDSMAAREFFQHARTATGVQPCEVLTDRAPTYPRVVDGMWPAAWHHREQYANNRIEADHAQLKRWLRPMRGIKTMTGLRVVAAGHAFVQNLRRGHYEIAADEPDGRRLAVAFTDLARPSDPRAPTTCRLSAPAIEQCNRALPIIKSPGCTLQDADQAGVFHELDDAP